MQNELDIVRDVSLRLEEGRLIGHWTRQLGLHNLWLECKP
jgi:hypothetical protein